MAVALNSHSTNALEGAGAASVSSSAFNYPAGLTNSALCLAAAFNGVDHTDFTAVTWGGTGLTFIGQTIPGSFSVFCYGLIAPASGTQTLSITWPAASTAYALEIYALTGVDQTNVATAFTNFTSAGPTTSTNSTITVTTGSSNNLALTV